MKPKFFASTRRLSKTNKSARLAFRHGCLLSIGVLTLIGAQSSQAINIYWDGVGGTANDWGSAGNWSTATGGGGTSAVPGSADVAVFSATSVGTPQTVNLNAARSLLGLSFTSSSVHTLLGGGTNQTLTLGASGIAKTGTGAVTIGSVTAGQQVALSLSSDQTWANDNNTGAITIVNGVAASTAVNRILTLGGTSTAANTVSGIIADNGAGVMSLTKSGAGTWVLSGANTYTGGTTLGSIGTVALGNKAALGNGGVLNVTAAGFLQATTDLSGVNKITNAVTVGANFTINGSQNLELGGNVTSSGSSSRTLTISNSLTTTLSGNLYLAENNSTTGRVLTLNGAGATVISGNIHNNNFGNTVAAGLTINNASAVVTLSGTNDYTGATTLSAGTINVNSNSAFGAAGSTVALNGVTLDNTSGSTRTLSNSAYTLGANNIYTGSGGSTLNLGTGTMSVGVTRTWTVNGGTLAIGGIISGAGGLTKSGIGTLALSGVNTYTGITTISGGVLSVGTIGNGGVAGNLGQAANPSANLVIGSGTLEYTGGTASTDRGFTVADSSIGTIEVATAGTTLTLGGAILEAGAASKTLTFGGVGNITFTGTITADNNDIFNITKNGAGALTLSAGLNDLEGGVVTVNMGSLNLDYTTVSGRLDDGSALALGGGTVNLQNGASAHTEVVASTTINTGASNVTRTSGTSILEMNTITRSVGGTLNLGAVGIVTANGTITVNGIVPWATINGTDWATKTTSNDAGITTYSGYETSTTIANWGTTEDISIGANPSANLNNTTINSLKFTGGSTATLNSSQTLTLTSGGILGTGSGATTITGGTLTIGGAAIDLIVHQYSSADMTIASVIANGTGTDGLTKSGTGKLILSGTNTYTGITSINAGTLVINGNQSSASGAVTVASIAKLFGTGAIGGATTILGTQSSGASSGAVGTQNFNSSLTYSSGSIFEWDINVTGGTDTHDRAIANSLSGSGAEFKIVGTGDGYAAAFWNTTRNWTASDLFGINNAAVNLSNIFNNTTSFNPSPLEGYFSFTDNGGTGNQLTWTAVPEPTSALAGILLGAGLFRRKRNQRQSA